MKLIRALFFFTTITPLFNAIFLGLANPIVNIIPSAGVWRDFYAMLVWSAFTACVPSMLLALYAYFTINWKRQQLLIFGSIIVFVVPLIITFQIGFFVRNITQTYLHWAVLLASTSLAAMGSYYLYHKFATSKLAQTCPDMSDIFKAAIFFAIIGAALNTFFWYFNLRILPYFSGSSTVANSYLDDRHIVLHYAFSLLPFAYVGMWAAWLNHYFSKRIYFVTIAIIGILTALILTTFSLLVNANNIIVLTPYSIETVLLVGFIPALTTFLLCSVLYKYGITYFDPNQSTMPRLANMLYFGLSCAFLTPLLVFLMMMITQSSDINLNSFRLKALLFDTGNGHVYFITELKRFAVMLQGAATTSIFYVTIPAMVVGALGGFFSTHLSRWILSLAVPCLGSYLFYFYTRWAKSAGIYSEFNLLLDNFSNGFIFTKFVIALFISMLILFYFLKEPAMSPQKISDES